MFKDRTDAGKQLAENLTVFIGKSDVLVLALPRGGVVTAAEIARRIKAPLEVLIVRKIGHPLEPELAAGALSETGSIVYNEDVLTSFGVTRQYLQREADRQREEIGRRQHLYRKGQKLRNLRGKTIILADDGVATGATIKAAVEALRRELVGKLVVTVPVAPPDAARELRSLTDVFVCLEIPEDFMAVGSYYMNFAPVSDEDVVRILEQFRAGGAAAA